MPPEGSEPSLAALREWAVLCARAQQRAAEPVKVLRRALVAGTIASVLAGAWRRRAARPRPRQGTWRELSGPELQ